MAGKKQQTFAKLQRERRVKEKRELKQEKKLAAAARKLEAANGDQISPGPEDEQDEAAETVPAPSE
jgi:hypothetical protein